MVVAVFLESGGVELWVFEFNVLLERALWAVVSTASFDVAVVLALDLLGGSSDSFFAVGV